MKWFHKNPNKKDSNEGKNLTWTCFILDGSKYNILEIWMSHHLKCNLSKLNSYCKGIFERCVSFILSTYIQ